MPLSWIAIASLLLTSCADIQAGNGRYGSYCHEHTAVCVLGGMVAAGAFIAIAAHHKDVDHNGPSPAPE